MSVTQMSRRSHGVSHADVTAEHHAVSRWSHRYDTTRHDITLLATRSKSVLRAHVGNIATRFARCQVGS